MNADKNSFQEIRWNWMQKTFQFEPPYVGCYKCVQEKSHLVEGGFDLLKEVIRLWWRPVLIWSWFSRLLFSVSDNSDGVSS
jgi:hypothetical protein